METGSLSARCAYFERSREFVGFSGAVPAGRITNTGAMRTHESVSFNGHENEPKPVGYQHPNGRPRHVLGLLWRICKAQFVVCD
jgi:hypothetical protein